MNKQEREWQNKNGTLSDGTAQKEFGLTKEDIIRAIRAGKLQYRVGSFYGNPFFRLLRREVEALVRGKRGSRYVEDQKTKKELAQVGRDLKRLKTQIADLEKRKAELTARLAK